MAYAATKERAHELIERLAPSQLDVVVPLLAVIVEPMPRHVPWEDEEISEDENRVAAEARARAYVASPNSHEGLLKELGLTPEDFDRMALERLDAEIPASHRG